MEFVKITDAKSVFSFDSVAGSVFSPRRVKQHVHEVEVIVGGKGHLGRSDEMSNARPGDMFWFYPEETVFADADKKEPYKTIVFQFLVERPPERRPPFKSSWTNLDECVSFCERALRKLTIEDCSIPSLECVYARLYWEAIEYELRATQKHAGQMDKALDYIEKHFSEEITVEDIAKFAGVSASHLHLLFRENVGDSPMKMVGKLRLRKAETLLRRTELSVKEIGFECGFKDVNNFCHGFRKSRGVPPGAFRKEQTNWAD